MNTTRTLLAPLAQLVLSACSGIYGHPGTAPAMTRDGVLVSPAGMTTHELLLPAAETVYGPLVP